MKDVNAANPSQHSTASVAEKSLGLSPAKGDPRVIVAEDQAMVMFSVVWAIKKAFGVEPLAQLTSIEETWTAVLKHDPELLILDLDLEGRDSTFLIRQILQIKPAVRILICSGSMAQEQICAVVKAGACGYFYKSEPPSQLALAMSTVYEGRRYFSPIAIDALSNHLHGLLQTKEHAELTRRELELLKLFAQGKTVKESSDILNISDKTVYAHRSTILQKTNCKDNVALTHYALKYNLIPNCL